MEMGFFDSLKSLFTGAEGQDRDGYWIYVRCRRCGEVIKTRLDLRNNLSVRDEGGFIARKTLIGGSHYCFQRIEVTLIFDESRQLVEREIMHGDFITAEEYEAIQSSAE
jgi:hypothetical protein